MPGAVARRGYVITAALLRLLALITVTMRSARAVRTSHRVPRPTIWFVAGVPVDQQ